MEQTKKPKQTSSSSSYTVIRVRKPTANKLRSLVNRLNRKPYGKKITATDVLNASLALLGDKEMKMIEEQSYTSQDRLEIAYLQYCKENGKITKDEYLALLLDVKLRSESPSSLCLESQS